MNKRQKSQEDSIKIILATLCTALVLVILGLIF